MLIDVRLNGLGEFPDLKHSNVQEVKRIRFAAVSSDKLRMPFIAMVNDLPNGQSILAQMPLSMFLAIVELYKEYYSSVLGPGTKMDDKIAIP